MLYQYCQCKFVFDIKILLQYNFKNYISGLFTILSINTFNIRIYMLKGEFKTQLLNVVKLLDYHTSIFSLII